MKMMQKQMVKKWVATPAGLPIVANYAMISMNIADFEGRFVTFDFVMGFYRLPLKIEIQI
jgi:hypothetical protein